MRIVEERFRCFTSVSPANGRVYFVAQFVDFWVISFVCVSNHWISLSNKRSRVARFWLLRDRILVIYRACTYTTLEREIFAYEIVRLTFSNVSL